MKGFLLLVLIIHCAFISLIDGTFCNCERELSYGELFLEADYAIRGTVTNGYMMPPEEKYVVSVEDVYKWDSPTPISGTEQILNLPLSREISTPSSAETCGISVLKVGKTYLLTGKIISNDLEEPVLQLHSCQSIYVEWDIDAFENGMYLDLDSSKKLSFMDLLMNSKNGCKFMNGERIDSCPCETICPGFESGEPCMENNQCPLKEACTCTESGLYRFGDRCVELTECPRAERKRIHRPDGRV